MMRLDAICMNLIALGETVKGLDKLTAGELLLNYPEIYWKGVLFVLTTVICPLGVDR
jgi:uncharacterized protein with HEPN domain